MQESGNIDKGFDFLRCRNEKALTEPAVREKLEHSIEEAGFTLIDSIFHVFEGGGEGYSFLAIIGESHVTVHTWPERKAAELTLHYCNFTQDNSKKAEHLLVLYTELFQPERTERHTERIRHAAEEKSEKKFGTELILDLIDCNQECISSKEHIVAYAKELCRVIDMKPYGEPFVERFGFGKDFTAGYSLVQLIETSSITGHFSELWGKAYINIFSCKAFDTDRAAAFTAEHFGAKRVCERVLVRK